MINNEKRLGIWIPVEFMQNKDLDWVNKALLTEICSLHQLPKGCIASNDYFGNLLGMTSGSASKRITQLSKLEYIKTENFYEKGGCIGRIIIPNEKKVKIYKANKVLDQQKGTSAENQSLIPERPGGSSLTTRDVLPERPGGSSKEHTINTSTSIFDLITNKNKLRNNSIEVQYTSNNYTRDQFSSNDTTGDQYSGQEGKSVEVNPTEELWKIFARAYDKFNKEEKDLFMRENDTGKLELIKNWEAQQNNLELNSESSTIGQPKVITDNN